MKRGIAGWVAAALVTTAALGWMILRPRPLQGGWKAIELYVSVEPNDAAVARLNARLDRLVAWRDLRNSEHLRFRLWDGRVVGDAKVAADDWDLAAYLRALRAVSVEEPGVRFAIESEPEGERLQLLDGKFGKRERAVARFLDELQGSRPNLEGQFTSLRLEAPGEPARLRAAMERQLGGFEWPHLTLPLEYAPAAGGTEVSARFDGDVRTLVRLLDALQSAVTEGDARLAQLPCRAVLDGKQRREVTLAGFEDWFHLRDELAMSEGPAADVGTRDAARVDGGAP